jgi:hypothetical protein
MQKKKQTQTPKPTVFLLVFHEYKYRKLKTDNKTVGAKGNGFSPEFLEEKRKFV